MIELTIQGHLIITLPTWQCICTPYTLDVDEKESQWDLEPRLSPMDQKFYK